MGDLGQRTALGGVETLGNLALASSNPTTSTPSELVRAADRGVKRTPWWEDRQVDHPLSEVESCGFRQEVQHHEPSSVLTVMLFCCKRSRTSVLPIRASHIRNLLRLATVVSDAEGVRSCCTTSTSRARLVMSRSLRMPLNHRSATGSFGDGIYHWPPASSISDIFTWIVYRAWSYGVCPTTPYSRQQTILRY